jgi:gas vesicle protein
MERMLRMMAGLLLGALIAAGLVLLFAPKNGAQTREQIQAWLQDVLAEGRQAAEVRRVELTTQFESLKQPRPGA